MKKGFTLIELLAVIIILAIVALIATPIILNVIEDARISTGKSEASMIYSGINNYCATSKMEQELNGTPDICADGVTTEEVSQMVNLGNAKVEEVIYNDKVTSLVVESNNHKFTLCGDGSFAMDDEECIVKPPIIPDEVNPTISQTPNINSNENGWYKEDIYITVNVVDNESGVAGYRRCVSDTECTPDSTIYTNNNILVNTESANNYVCVIGVDNQGNESEKDCQIYKLDKTAPIINGVGDITVNLNEEVDLSNGVTYSDELSQIDGTLSITPLTIDTSTIGVKEVTYNIKDKAGNEAIVTRQVEVLGDAPSIVFSTTGSFNSNGWAKSDFYVKASVTDNSNKGISSIKWCSTTDSSCTPTAIVDNVNVLISTESANNKVCVEAIDNNGKTTTLCSNSYKLDKTLPTINGVGDITVNRNDTVDLSNGVTYSDTLSQIDGTLTITPSTIDTSVTGVKEVTYSIKDKAGNVREVVRRITVDADAPSIVFNLVDSSVINSNKWAKEDFYIRATITDNSGSGIKSGSSCTVNSSSECTPSASFTGTTKDFLITTEGSNRACVQVTDNNNKTTKVCSDTYNLDKTAPTAGTATFTGTLGSNNWYTTNVTVNVENGSDSLSGHSSTTSSIASITSNTASQTVTITTTDKAGNSATRSYTIKVDKNAPTLTAKSGTVEIKEGDSNVVANYFTVSYSTSGGSISCTPTNTSSLAVGSRTLSCTATGGNGKTTTATKSITVKANEYEDTTGANKPELASNMIPIKYNGSNWVYADISEEWYDYNSKEWANAVVLNSGVSKSVGQTISESEIALWYVWIPRYKYQLFNANNGSVSQQLINVTFESGTATTGTVKCTDAVSGSGSSSQTCTNASNGNWYTHPAFTFGSEQVSGFWVGKFEVSGSTSKITVKPGVSSLRSTTVSAFFTAIQNIKSSYSLSGDSHMMKNMEWGAVAYLKQSKYGLGTTDITINSNSSYYTGGGSSTTSYKSNTGQSTTGNVYGVYDMSGGAWEYVMGNMVNSSGSFYSSNAGFSSAPNAKYYDKYTYSSDWSTHSRGKLGDATKETLKSYGSATGGWYSDQANFVYSSGSWFIRGGYCGSGSYAGVFNFSGNAGGSGSTFSARAVLIP